jgi:photosystem II stability/assembly factor-like uncharacterized protein
VTDWPATQPTIAATPDGGLLTAAEFNDGRQAVMVTLFVPMEGAAPGEAGSLLYHVPADHRTRRAEDG